MDKLVNIENITQALSSFKGAVPFDHCVVDGFFTEEVSRLLEAEFPNYDDDCWYEYANQIENKKALNNWNAFGPNTYKIFSYLNSEAFRKVLSDAIGVELLPDNGLHGGGWHIHANGGNLNPHYDYSIHPKLKKQRKVNIIIYMSPTLKEGMGGELGLWHHDAATNSPAELDKEVQPKFNRAVIFDTTQNSWHGMSRKLDCPEGVYRKSLAIYYLCEPADGCDLHERALFAPREEQKDDEAVRELIAKRADVSLSKDVYKAKA